ncbi:MAG: c-type cytochrome [Dehalococcoidia bacterium]|nr:c-type cytochrome [Dehalococcoidia bacterium]
MTQERPTGPFTPQPSRRETEREEYHRIYHEFKEKGHPFWPDAIFEDLIAILITLGVLLTFIIIEGAPLGNVANPASREFVPRPEWYFLFLFEFLKYIPGQFEWLGIALVPALFIIFLVLLPFIDRGQQAPSLGISVGSLLRLGGAALMLGIVFLTFQAYKTSPPSLVTVEVGPRLTATQQMGRNIYEANCIACHQIAGGGFKGGIPLDGVGSRMTVAELHSFIENPRSINPRSNMPGFSGTLTHTEVEAVSQYLSLFKTGARR